MKLNHLLASSMVIFSIGAFEIFVLDLGSSEVKKYSAQSSNVAKIKSPQPAVRRTSGPQNRQTFIRPTRPFLFPAVLSPAAFLLPAAVGKMYDCIIINKGKIMGDIQTKAFKARTHFLILYNSHCRYLIKT